MSFHLARILSATSSWFAQSSSANLAPNRSFNPGPTVTARFSNLFVRPPAGPVNFIRQASRSHCGFAHIANMIPNLPGKRYWSAPFGRHQCPECLGQFQLRFSIGQIASRWCIALSVRPLSAIIYTRTEGWLIPAVFYAAYCCLIMLPLDRVIDDRWRKATPLFPVGPA